MSKSEEREVKSREDECQQNVVEDGAKREAEKPQGDAPDDDPKLDAVKIIGNG